MRFSLLVRRTLRHRTTAFFLCTLVGLSACGKWDMDFGDGGDWDLGGGDWDFGLGIALGDAGTLGNIVNEYDDRRDEGPTLQLIGLTPDRANPGDLIVLTGKGFPGYHVQVRFSPSSYALPVTITDTALVVRVPDDAVSGPVLVVTATSVSKPQYLAVARRAMDRCDKSACPAGTFATAEGCGYAGAVSTPVAVQVQDYVLATAVSATTLHVVDPLTYALTGVCSVAGADGRTTLQIEGGVSWSVVATRFVTAVDTYSTLATAGTSTTVPLFPLWAWQGYGAHAGKAMSAGGGLIMGQLQNPAGQPVTDDVSTHLWEGSVNEAHYFPAGSTHPVPHSELGSLSPSNAHFVLLNTNAGAFHPTLVRGIYASRLAPPAILSVPYSATIIQATCPSCP